MVSAAYVFLEYVCPFLGMIINNIQYLAPLNDHQAAVKNGTGLQNLNPTPWACMLGNCLGWTAYGLLTADWWVFLAECPGFLISCWLNLGAVKLMYSSHHQKETRQNMVTFLAESDRVQYEENERKSKQEQQKDDGDDDDDGDEENSKPSMQQVHGIWFQKVEEKEENADGTCDDDAIAVNQEEKDSDNGETSDEIEGKDNKEIEGNNNKEISIESKEGPLVGFTLQASQQYENSSPSRRDLRKVRSRMRKEKSSLRRQASKALRRERSEKMRQWADIVWDVTSQKTPAAAPHELLVMIVILVWVVVLSFVGWYNYYAVTDGGADEVAQKIVGIVATINTVFFFAAPLSSISTILKTKKSDTIHLPSMITSTLGCTFWVAYAVAIKDAILAIPSALGLLFCLILLALSMIFPKTKFEKGLPRPGMVKMFSSAFLMNAYAESMSGASKKTNESSTAILESVCEEGTNSYNLETSLKPVKE